MIINDRIKLIRKKAGLSQLDFGKRIGVSESAVSNYESGRRTISEQTLILVCREFHINYEWLTTGEGSMSSFSEEEQQLALLQETYSLSDIDMSILKAYISLNSQERAAFYSFLKKIKGA